MHSKIQIYMPNLACTLMLDFIDEGQLLNDDVVEPRVPMARSALLDDDITGFFDAINWDTSTYASHTIVHPPMRTHGMAAWELSLMQALAPAVLDGSFIIWQDGEGAPFKAVIIEQGRLVTLTEEQAGIEEG
jgi:hypothetical protein